MNGRRDPVDGDARRVAEDEDGPVGPGFDIADQGVIRRPGEPLWRDEKIGDAVPLDQSLDPRRVGVGLRDDPLPPRLEESLARVGGQERAGGVPVGGDPGAGGVERLVAGPLRGGSAGRQRVTGLGKGGGEQEPGRDGPRPPRPQPAEARR